MTSTLAERSHEAQPANSIMEKKFFGERQYFFLRHMSRKDQRTAAQIRPLACEQSPLQRADGSARFDMGMSSSSKYGIQFFAFR